MSRETTPQAIDAVPAAGALVLRGVVLGRDARTLARPRPGGPGSPPPRPGDKPVIAAAQPAVVQFSHSDAAPPSPAVQEQQEQAAQYQERGRGFQAGYEEGRHQGHAEGLALGEEQGRREGEQAGFEAGRQAAQQAVDQEHAAARQAVADRIGRLDALLDGLATQIDQRLDLAQEDVLALCFEAVARIMGEAAAGAEGSRAIVLQALQEAKLKQAATVRVNPRDLSALQGDEAIEAWLGAGRRVQWLPDERVALGGCLVAAPEGGLDARLETQLARLAALFADARRKAAE